MQFLSEGVETLGTPFAFVPLQKLERGRMQNSRMEEERKYMPFYACFFMWSISIKRRTTSGLPVCFPLSSLILHVSL